VTHSNSRTHTHTHTHTYTLGRTPLDGGSACRRELYLTTKHSQEADIHVPGGIRTSNPNKRAAAKLRLRLRGQRDTHCHVTLLCLIDNSGVVQKPFSKYFQYYFMLIPVPCIFYYFVQWPTNAQLCICLVIVQNKKKYFQYCSYREVNYGKGVYRNWLLFFR
jgi:hypothetical protein